MASSPFWLGSSLSRHGAKSEKNGSLFFSPSRCSQVPRRVFLLIECDQRPRPDLNRRLPHYQQGRLTYSATGPSFYFLRSRALTTFSQSKRSTRRLILIAG